MAASEESPWAERYRDYLHRLGAGQVAAALQGKVDLSGVVQDALWEAAGLPEPADEGHARRLVCQVFAHKLRDAVRACLADKRDARREVAGDGGGSADGLLAGVPQYTTTPSGKAARNEQVDRVWAALAGLPDEQRDAIILHHVVGLTVDETADTLGVEPEQVARHLRLGLKRLRDDLATPDGG